jgi:predicted RNase H-like HicB family nuclease
MNWRGKSAEIWMFLSLNKGVTPVQYRAVIKKSDGWWIGWLIDLPGVNAQEKTKKELLESLKIGAEDMLNTPFEPTAEEELVSIEV